MNISTVGIDLAKNVFQIHGANERGTKIVEQAITTQTSVKILH